MNEDDPEIYQEQNSNQSSQPCYVMDVCNSNRFHFSNYWDDVPQLNIRINVHFIKTADYGLNFGPSNGNCSGCTLNNEITGYAVAQRIIDQCNLRLSQLQEFRLRRDLNLVVPGQHDGYFNPDLPFPDNNGFPVNVLTDSKIRLELYEENELGSVHFHELETFKYSARTYTSSSPCYDGQTGFPTTSFSQFSVYGNKVIDLFFADEYYPVESYVENDTTRYCRAIRGSASGSQANQYNMWYYWKEANGGWGTIDHYSGLILHEIGHTLGLSHPFGGGECCDANETPYANIDYIGNTARHNWDISNNIMGYNSRTNTLSPCQLDIAHVEGRKKSFVYVSTPNTLDLCNKVSGVDEITGNVIWDEDRNVFKDIWIKSGGILEIRGDICIGLAKNVHIHVERGAMLYINGDNGSPLLRSICTSGHMPSNNLLDHPIHWGGIVVAGNPQRNHPEFYDDPFNSDGQDPGRVVIRHASIMQARRAITTDWVLEYRPDLWGGYIYCDGVNFRGCHRVAEFMRYKRPNKSKFYACTVRGYKAFSQDTVYQGSGISAWDCRGIEIAGCLFENLRNYALFTLGGDFKVTGANTFRDFPAHAIFAGKSSSSIDSDIRIEIDGSTYGFNQFNNNKLDILLENYTSTAQTHTIKKNEFLHPTQDVNGNIGVHLLNSKALVAENLITNKYTGVLSESNLTNPNIIINNYFLNQWYGIMYRGSNRGSEFRCNEFYNSRWGVWVTNGASIKPIQGTPFLSNSNKWYRTRPTSVNPLDIVVRTLDVEIQGGQGSSMFNTGQFIYYVKNGTPLIDPLRPICNITHSCSSFTDQDYSIEDSADNHNCTQVNPGSEPYDEYSIHELMMGMDSIIQSDSLYKYNNDYIFMANSKYQKIIDTAHSLQVIDNHSAVDSLLAAQPEALYQWYRYGQQVSLGNYSAASTLLAANASVLTDTENQDIVEVQTINLKWQQDLSYRPDSIDKTTLEEIAVKSGVGAAQARVLLTWWYDHMWPPQPIEEPEDSIAVMPIVGEIPLGKTEDERSISNNWSIHPNPGRGIYTLRSDSDLLYPVEIELYQAGSMKQMFHQKLTSYGNPDMQMDVSHLPAGVYVLKVWGPDSEQHTFLKLIKL